MSEIDVTPNDTGGCRVGPPNITPFSGVLPKGKVVIRPIAFKPVSTRFSSNGERYGSTPILARPGSQLTLYGSSSDLQGCNYSLDRKLQLMSASPPPPAPLTAAKKFHQGYDSLESVCKSPASQANSSSSSKSSCLRASGDAGSLLDLTPSPSDSGVGELEAALRDRDSELAYLRQTMEHNEQVIFSPVCASRVYQEKEKLWERELRRMKNVHESRLRTGAQKIHKLEQMLMLHSYQLQEEKKRLRQETEAATREASELRQEVTLLRGRLEETEWGLCQKSGELSLLKAQLKESQGEQNSKGQEVAQLRGQVRELRSELDHKDNQLSSLRLDLQERDEELARLQKNICKLQTDLDATKAELEEAKKTENIVSEEDVAAQARLRSELHQERIQFAHERLTWAQEKEKVLRYQRQLQLNYVQMFRRTKSLEAEVECLTLELDSKKTVDAIQL